MAARQWTQAQRDRQAKLIHRWKPWEKSTGPITERGKALASKNAVNYATREVLRHLVKTNRELLPKIERFMEFRHWLEERGFYDAITPDMARHDTAILDALLADFAMAWAKKYGR